METIKQKHLTGERVLYNTHDLRIEHCNFDDGESPIKETHDMIIDHCIFGWKYPIWYSQHIKVIQSTLLEAARAGIWYVDDIEMVDCMIEAPKTFRRASHITLKNTDMPDALESMWNCKDIHIENMCVKGDYFAFNSENIYIDHMCLTGSYCFDSCKNIEIHNSKLISKDSFWSCENVTVYDSVLVGEYLAWNSKNVRFVNCTIESNQGLCYIDDLTIDHCHFIHTDLAFEECTNINAYIEGSIDSIKNPINGTIYADEIKELILNPRRIDPTKTTITTKVPCTPVNEYNEWEI